jgi:hypothetical protein
MERDMTECKPYSTYNVETLSIGQPVYRKLLNGNFELYRIVHKYWDAGIAEWSYNVTDKTNLVRTFRHFQLKPLKLPVDYMRQCLRAVK